MSDSFTIDEKILISLRMIEELLRIIIKNTDPKPQNQRRAE